MIMSKKISYRGLTVALFTLYGGFSGVASFQPTSQLLQNRQPTALAAGPATTSMATLTDETTWTMRMNLENLQTEKGKKTDGIYVVQAKFIEEEGYEPPQGRLQQFFAEEETASDETVSDDGAGEISLSSNSQMIIQSGRWTLSEDPNDRKDSLWIWGLFKDPLYPFLLLQFDIEAIPLPGEENDSIKPLRLFAQINHSRGENGEVILSSVSDLTVREKETYKADPFGAAKIDLFENVVVGKLQLQAR